MQITVDIPDETAADMLGHSKDPATSLLELAGYAACNAGRISEYQYSKLLGLEWRLDVHGVMKRIRLEEEAVISATMEMDRRAMESIHQNPEIAKAG